MRQPEDAEAAPFPERKLEYTIRPTDLGNGDFGRIAVSWIDDGDLRVYGVGTREILSGDGNGNCGKALRTLRQVVKEYSPEIGFTIEDVCAGGNENGHNFEDL